MPNIRRSPDSLKLLVQVARERGMAPELALEGTGVEEEHLADPDLEVTASQEFVAIRNVQRRFGTDAGLGLEIGLRWPLSFSGILGYALLSSPTVRSALELFLRFSELAYAYFPIFLEEDAGEARIVFDDSGAPTDLRQFLVERMAGAFSANAVQVLGVFPPVTRCEVRFPPPPYASRIVSAAKVEVRFDAPRNVIGVEAAFLERALPQANALTRRLCEEQCRELLMRRRERVGRSEQVRQLLLGSPADMPDIQKTAKHFGVSSRTLRRELSREATSYRELVDEVRYALADELLQRGLSVEDVSERLGFSEPAAFVRAFRRWSGETPGRARRARTGAKSR